MVMKYLALSIPLLLGQAASALAQEPPTLAVFPTIVAESAKGDFERNRVDPQELTRQLEESIRSARRFKLFERSAEVLQKSVRTEQEFARSGQALNNAAEVGRLSNVQFIAQPLITQANLNVRRTQREEIPGQYRYAASGSVTITLKVLDTTSAEIMYQVTRDISISTGNDVGARFNAPSDEGAVKTAAWTRVSGTAAAQLTNAMIGAMDPIKVIDAQGSNVFVNRGEGGGIAAGEIYQIYSIGSALIDPVTKEKLGEAEELLGEVEVVRVNPKFSITRPRSPLAGKVKAGDVLRPMN
jgi:hypothetical protein